MTTNLGILILLGLASLLALGCVASNQNPAQAPAAPANASGAPAQTAASSGVGDADITPAPLQNDSDLISQEPVIPPDNSTSSVNVTGSVTNLTDSDLDTNVTQEQDLISESDVVEPG